VNKKIPLKKDETLPSDSSSLRANEYRGLCSTCKNALECTYPRDPKRRILQCEEFEGTAKISSETSRARITLVKEAELNAEAELKGLCKLCERRSTCAYPKPEGGVWHCEEYE
jgi:hypothetical protein